MKRIASSLEVGLNSGVAAVARGAKTGRLAGHLAGSLLNLALLAGPAIYLLGPGRLMFEARAWTFLGLIMIWYWAEIGCCHRHSGAPPRAAKGAWLPFATGLTLFVALSLSLLESAIRAPGPFSWISWLGAGWMLLGVILRCLAIRRLGHFFLDQVARLSNQPLITSGVYARLRHPSEAGNLCLVFGTALLLGSLSGLCVGGLLLLPFVLYRLRLEDSLLLESFPEQFPTYARLVPALLPRLGTIDCQDLKPAAENVLRAE